MTRRDSRISIFPRVHYKYIAEHDTNGDKENIDNIRSRKDDRLIGVDRAS
jgi:hypothetical protein